MKRFTVFFLLVFVLFSAAPLSVFAYDLTNVPDPLNFPPDSEDFDTVFWNDFHVAYFNLAEVTITLEDEDTDLPYYQINDNGSPSGGSAYFNCTPVRVDCSIFGSFTGTAIYVSKDFVTGDPVHFHSSNPAFDYVDPNEFALGVVFPDLTDGEADVQPSPRFIFKANYHIPPEYSYEDVYMGWSLCNETYSDCELEGYGTLEQIRDDLGPSENGFFYGEVPVSLGDTTYVSLILGNEDFSTAHEVFIFQLTGSDAGGLPGPSDALDGSYQDIPNPLTDPYGFVQGVFYNAQTWLGNIFTPSPGYLSSYFGEYETLLDTQFPMFTQIADLLESAGATWAGAGSTYTVPELTVFGHTVPILNTTILDDILPTLKAWMSVLIWLFAMVFAFQSVRSYFSHQ
ncbi:MAG: hypothetical protein WDN67_05170 [Candidatus Moraniibacteriota bacterium]